MASYCTFGSPFDPSSPLPYLGDEMEVFTNVEDGYSAQDPTKIGVSRSFDAVIARCISLWHQHSAGFTSWWRGLTHRERKDWVWRCDRSLTTEGVVLETNPELTLRHLWYTQQLFYLPPLSSNSSC